MPEKTFTETEAMHLVAREVAKQRMSDIERTIKEGEHRSVIAFSKLEAQIQALFNLVEKQSIAMEKANDGLREEIKKDFATKIEVAADFEKLNTKIDTQWSKLMLIVSTVTAVGVVANFLIKFL